MIIYPVSLKLLRCGATTIVTSRFPVTSHLNDDFPLIFCRKHVDYSLTNVDFTIQSGGRGAPFRRRAGFRPLGGAVALLRVRWAVWENDDVLLNVAFFPFKTDGGCCVQTNRPAPRGRRGELLSAYQVLLYTNDDFVLIFYSEMIVFWAEWGIFRMKMVVFWLRMAACPQR